jgi:hypothetical protein
MGELTRVGRQDIRTIGPNQSDQRLLLRFASSRVLKCTNAGRRGAATLPSSAVGLPASPAAIAIRSVTHYVHRLCRGVQPRSS